VFEALERHLDAEGLTFYFTWHLDHLPRYGDDVVAVVMGDEWGRYPLYTNRVRAVFKMLGTDFPFEATPSRTPFPLTAVTALKYARTQALRLPNRTRAWADRWWAKATGTPTGHVFDIPIGYVKQDPLPLKPLDERAYDLYFSGSVANREFAWHTMQYWLRTPKDVARSDLIDAMRRLRDTRSDLNIEVDPRLSYVPQRRDEDAAPPRSYSEMMMDTRISPVPRGTRLETSRLYEALRYGCVVITEPLPDRWYTRDLPALVVHDWAELPALVADLVRQPDRLRDLHNASLAWWNDVCSEEAVGRYMAEQLNGLAPRSHAAAPAVAATA
jgi:hypothetical protein